MRISLTASLLVCLVLFYPVRATSSAFPEDLEGSGFDPGVSGSGSGEWLEPDESTDSMDYSNRRDHALDGLSWSLKDSEYVTVSNSKSLWENKQIVAGIAAGGVAGVALAAILAGLLIYTWHKKEEGGYIQGQQTHREDIV
ncbi:hypothetical protein JOB18_041141 [Solea senegalensis]|uniref:Syndecan/Neurexin domain-containing protein n=1 Tax=Solea senegalensis TaxID=28829 RepID=A0AAV6RWK2_SOLSE|nr:syndecan-2-like [Solea senegalensis]KAG7509324.1 hypothetical protein JOB18_041141 [Solea senegalensis]